MSNIQISNQSRIGTKPKMWIYALSLLVLVLSACSKDYLAPEAEETEELVNDYQLISIAYFLGEGDGIDTMTLERNPETISNHSAALVKRDYVDSWDDLTKTSTFRWDPTKADLPDDLELSDFEVIVPHDYHAPEEFSYYVHKFPLSAQQQEEADTSSKTTTTLNLNIPAHSRFTIFSSVDQYEMVCSFKAVIRNETTGIRYEVTGKWEGTLRHNNGEIRLEEDPFN